MDALRGIALFGILLVNIFVFHAPYSHYGAFYGAFEGMQQAAVEIVVSFAAGKFLFIFAFLFGYGIVLQFNSLKDAFSSYFIKRMSILMLMGVLHTLVFWFGDILLSYALLGFMAMPFVKAANKTLVALGVFFLLFRPMYYLGALLFQWPMVNMDQSIDLETFLSVFSDGNYIDIFKLRMFETWSFLPENLVWYIPKTLGLFFMGMYAARKNLFAIVNTHQLKILVLFLVLLICSATWEFTKINFFKSIDLEAQPLWRPALIGMNVTFEFMLGSAYILGFTLLFVRLRFLKNLLAKTGKMALSNYIIQSVICVIIFYGYGLGYYGKLLPSDLVLLTLGIFLFNILFSQLYLKRYQQGPLEYVWRKTAGRKKP